jgi:hypothetical protein
MERRLFKQRLVVIEQSMQALDTIKQEVKDLHTRLSYFERKLDHFEKKLDTFVLLPKRLATVEQKLERVKELGRLVRRLDKIETLLGQHTEAGTHPLHAPTDPLPDTEFMSITDFSRRIGVPAATARGWILRGVVPSIRIGRRRMIRTATLAHLLKNRT